MYLIKNETVSLPCDGNETVFVCLVIISVNIDDFGSVFVVIMASFLLELIAQTVLNADEDTTNQKSHLSPGQPNRVSVNHHSDEDTQTDQPRNEKHTASSVIPNAVHRSPEASTQTFHHDVHLLVSYSDGRQIEELFPYVSFIILLIPDYVNFCTDTKKD
jgi:hypothetical protein